MNSWDIFYISLAIGVLIITTCVIYLTFYLTKALKSITKLVNEVETGAEEIKFIKSQLKVKVLTTFIAVLAGLLGRFFKKRG